MGKIAHILKKKEVGSTGIGAMIVFIAVVLVAGIAASVLIQTAMKLETQAMTTGAQTIGEVATGVAVSEIEGYNRSSTGTIGWIAIGIRCRAGSQDVDLSNTVIEISNSVTKNFLTYDSTFHTPKASIAGNIFTRLFYPEDSNSSNTTNSSVTFGIIVLEDADNSCQQTTPVINKGDHIMLTVNTSACFGGLSTRKDVFGMVIPELGSPGMISFTTPSAYNAKVLELQ